MDDLIAVAIRDRRLIRFYYAATSSPGVRTVEPHVLGTNRKGSLALSAWFLRGESASAEGPGWREYLLDSVSEVEVLDEVFEGPRPGYRPGGGRNFTSVRAAL